ncbi:hypothetical protein M0R88_15070 [Halorussus gelatinilyticus]|uniref:Uncharacterized protein n=1 Tax=Halorussus gelatinilyticus TaxID=2937524 RepID=A0A8U0IG20_9EURY|nr:hypothetical protein [Halorussus gelatinilyticus]UPV99827.1 hypothetical protein M0R88_15070 [Halorussus gelatinilyticus]
MDDHDDQHVDADDSENLDVDHEDYSEMDDHTDDIHGHEAVEMDRVTSPMQEFSMSQVGIGFAVLAVGLAVAFAVPLLAA